MSSMVIVSRVLTNEQSSFRVIVQNEVKETNVVHIATNAD